MLDKRFDLVTDSQYEMLRVSIATHRCAFVLFRSRPITTVETWRRGLIARVFTTREMWFFNCVYKFVEGRVSSSYYWSHLSPLSPFGRCVSSVAALLKHVSVTITARSPSALIRRAAVVLKYKKKMYSRRPLLIGRLPSSRPSGRRRLSPPELIIVPFIIRIISHFPQCVMEGLFSFALPCLCLKTFCTSLAFGTYVRTNVLLNFCHSVQWLLNSSLWELKIHLNLIVNDKIYLWKHRIVRHEDVQELQL